MPRCASIPGRLSGTIDRFCKDESGVAAIEFGIFAAVLVPLFLIATDIGFILRERIVLDHVLRMGAYTAIADNPSPERVEDVMQLALEDQQSPRITPTALVVGSTCFCRLQPTANIRQRTHKTRSRALPMPI